LDIQRIKEHILDNNLVADVLSELGCHSLKQSTNMVQGANPDGGDNPTAVCVYLNDNLTTLDYTRQILPEGHNRTTDLIDFIIWARSCNFIEAIKWLCGFCGLDYYAEEEELPDSLQILQLITQMNKECGVNNEEDMTPLKPIDPKILSYYLPVGNILFERDGISLETQRFFEISYDPQSNHIVIPIRDSMGTLVGIKGRIFQDPVPEGQNKYVYLMPCAKGRVLYGLDKNIDNIIQQGVVYIGESEKFVQQIYDIGYYGVATGGSKVSKHQVQMLTRLGVKIVICFDKDIEEDELKKIASQFVEGVPVYAILDRDNILNEKESPSDDVSKWRHLVQNNIYKITKEREEVDRDVD
jgi:DNA primase